MRKDRVVSEVKNIIVLLFIIIFTSGCVPINKLEVDKSSYSDNECMVISAQADFEASVYTFKCPENEYRCFHVGYGVSCFQIHEN